MHLKNALILRKALIAQSHADFDMSVFLEQSSNYIYENPEGRPHFDHTFHNHRCGTTACMGGTAKLLQSEIEQIDIHLTNPAEWLDLEHNEEMLLFYCLDRYDNEIVDLRNVELHHAIAALDALILKKTIDWLSILQQNMPPISLSKQITRAKKK